MNYKFQRLHNNNCDGRLHDTPADADGKMRKRKSRFLIENTRKFKFVNEF